MPTHLLYIDDSGTKEYADSPEDYGSGNTRHFVFGGLLIAQEEIETLLEAIRESKRDCFHTDSVEIKSNWLRIPKERRARYLDPFGITEEELHDFVESYYGIVADADLMLIASVVDKVHMQEDYATPWYAPAVAYEAILQRVENELGDRGGRVSVVIDDMTGATPKHNQYKANLKRHHDRLRQHGSRLKSGFTFTCLEGRVKFVPSNRNHLIQVADLVAYNVYRQFREHGDAWEEYAGKPLPTYGWFERLGPKFRSSASGRVQGYGVVKLPLRQRVPWAVVDDEEEPTDNETAP